MRWILVVAIATGCMSPPVLRQDIDTQGQRISQLEQRMTALEAYIRQLYDVLAKNGALAAPPAAPSPAPAPAPAPAAPR